MTPLTRRKPNRSDYKVLTMFRREPGRGNASAFLKACAKLGYAENDRRHPSGASGLPPGNGGNGGNTGRVMPGSGMSANSAVTGPSVDQTTAAKPTTGKLEDPR